MRAGSMGRVYASAVLYALAASTLIVVSIGMVILLRLSGQAADQRDTLITQTKQGTALSRLVVECVTPPRERVPPETDVPASDCFARTEKRQSGIVKVIGDLSAVAAACGAAHPGDIPATRKCVSAELVGS